MPNFQFNKILLLIIAALLLVTIFVGAKIFNWQKTHVSLDISPEAMKAKCLGEVSKMTDEQIIEKIDTLAFATGEDLKNLNQLMLKHLMCEFRADPTDENNYNKIKDFLRKTKIPQIEDYLAILENSRSSSSPNMVFPNILALKSFEFLCIDNKTDPKVVEKCLENLPPKFFPTDFVKESCAQTCERLLKYSKNTQALNEEIINFTDWFKYGEKSYADIKPAVIWHIGIAYRFTGETGAQKICANLPSSVKDSQEDCLAVVNGIKDFEEKQKDCPTLSGEIVSDICKVSNK